MLVLLSACDGGNGLAGIESRCASTSTEPSAKLEACTALLKHAGASHAQRLAALLNRGELLVVMHDQKGLQDARHALDMQPENADVRRLMGIALAEFGDFEAGAKQLHEALRIDPTHQMALANLGQVLERAGHWEEALTATGQALAVYPNHPMPLAERCWILGILDRDLETADRDCTSAIEQEFDVPNNQNSRGFVRFRQGRHALAIADYDLSLRANPNMASSYYVRGLAKLALGQSAEGWDDIAQARTLEPKVAERYASYGVAIPAAP